MTAVVPKPKVRDIIADKALMQHVATIPNREWGPAMQALDLRARTFVFAVVKLGMDHTKAAREVSDANPDNLGRIGYRFAHREDVLAGMREMLSRQFVAEAPDMLRVITQVAKYGVRDADRIKAAKTVLDVAGFAAEQRIAVSHEHTINAGPTLAELYRSVGLTPPKGLLTHDPGVVIDADFEEVEPEGSTAGLEDLL